MHVLREAHIIKRLWLRLAHHVIIESKLVIDAENSPRIAHDIAVLNEISVDCVDREKPQAIVANAHLVCRIFSRRPRVRIAVIGFCRTATNRRSPRDQRLVLIIIGN